MRLKIIIIALLAAAFVTLGVFYLRSASNTPEPVSPAAAAVSDPKGITQDQLVRAYVELATLAETTPIGTPEYDKAKTRVLAQIGLEPGQIEKTLAEYNEHPEKWRPIWDRIQEELTKRNALPVDTTPKSEGAKKPL
jgi:hypothetical protein